MGFYLERRRTSLDLEAFQSAMRAVFPDTDVCLLHQDNGDIEVNCWLLEGKKDRLIVRCIVQLQTLVSDQQQIGGELLRIVEECRNRLIADRYNASDLDLLNDLCTKETMNADRRLGLVAVRETLPWPRSRKILR